MKPTPALIEAFALPGGDRFREMYYNGDEALQRVMNYAANATPAQLEQITAYLSGKGL